MTDYLQPDFYRFNEDSLKLVSWVCDSKIKANSILDIGCGSGVIGIELTNRLHPARLTLLEVQEEFRSYLTQNISTQLKVSLEVTCTISSFSKWESDERFDLIVCNPPYYLPQHGQLAADPRRSIARSFIIDGWGDLLKTCVRALTREGRAVMVIKQDEVLSNHIKEVMPLELVSYWHEVHGLMFLELTRLNKY